MKCVSAADAVAIIKSGDRAFIHGTAAAPQQLIATMTALGHHRRLGLHTEMFSDGLIDLVKRGVITGEEKRVHPGKIVSTFVRDTRRVYDFVDDNPFVAMLDFSSQQNRCKKISPILPLLTRCSPLQTEDESIRVWKIFSPPRFVSCARRPKRSREKIAPYADEIDRNFLWPEHSMRALAEAGLMGLHVPKMLGGQGQGLLAMVSITKASSKPVPQARSVTGCIASALR